MPLKTPKQTVVSTNSISSILFALIWYCYLVLVSFGMM